MEKNNGKIIDKQEGVMLRWVCVVMFVLMCCDACADVLVYVFWIVFVVDVRMLLLWCCSCCYFFVVIMQLYSVLGVAHHLYGKCWGYLLSLFLCILLNYSYYPLWNFIIVNIISWFTCSAPPSTAQSNLWDKNSHKNSSFHNICANILWSFSLRNFFILYNTKSSSSSPPPPSSSSPPARLQKPPLHGVGPNGEFLFMTRKSENTRNHHHNLIHHHQYNLIHTTTTIKREKVGFFPRSGSTALVPRPSPYRTLKSKLIRAGDIELNPGPKQPCGECGKTCTAKALRCTMCSGLSRTEVVRFRETDNYQCWRCRPQNPFHLCTKCERSFRIGQNGLKCHSCNLPTHLGCTRLTRNEREKAKTGALSCICCLRSTMSNDQETEDDQNDDVDNNDRVPQKCAKFKHSIRHKAPKATCNDCGAH